VQSVNGLWRVALFVVLCFIALELYRIDQSLRWVAAPVRGLASLASAPAAPAKDQSQAEWERERAEEQCRYIGKFAGPDEAKKCQERLKSSPTSPRAQK
jgi:hypothetical protein